LRQIQRQMVEMRAELLKVRGQSTYYGDAAGQH
jgi:hypothetical protein